MKHTDNGAESQKTSQAFQQVRRLPHISDNASIWAADGISRLFRADFSRPGSKKLIIKIHHFFFPLCFQPGKKKDLGAAFNAVTHNCPNRGYN